VRKKSFLPAVGVGKSFGHCLLEIAENSGGEADRREMHVGGNVVNESIAVDRVGDGER
jgi:hypothetical protein